MLKRLAAFLFALVIWYLITWPYDFKTGAFNLELTVAGAAVSLVAAFILGDVFTPAKHKRNLFYRLGWGLLYVPVLFFYIILANLDVLYRILHPKRPINPGIVKVKTRLKSAAGRTILANSITLTPGTMTVDLRDSGVLYIHCINVKTTDVEQATKQIVAPFERILIKVFE